MFCCAQNMENYNSFRENLLSGFKKERQDIYNRYNSFRDSINAEYSKSLRGDWGNYSRSNPKPRPKEDNFVPPTPYVEPQEDKKTVVTPTVAPNNIPDIKPSPQPEPIEPIKDKPVPGNDKFRFKFYGIEESVRIPKEADLGVLQVNNNDKIANAWRQLSKDGIDNTVYDLLQIRSRYNLCDWSYLQLLESLASQFCRNKNAATMLMSYLFCQSGYQMRLGHDGNNLYMLFGSKHQIYEKPYFDIGGISFYPYTSTASSLSVCPARFQGETPLSLLIGSEQKLGNELSDKRYIQSSKNPDFAVYAQVPVNLIKFFETYPPSSIGGNSLTRWAMYANTPLSQSVRESVYPALRNLISGCNKLEAANKLLNWIQTSFEYQVDENVWGHDRAFFVEESLYYPYTDCEDRSILYSRLVRDLLGLDVALVYYPGHLATAVRFEEDVDGDAMLINGKRFTVCDPTFIGAPVGSQMPNLDLSKVRSIVLD